MIWRGYYFVDFTTGLRLMAMAFEALIVYGVYGLGDSFLLYMFASGWLSIRVCEEKLEADISPLKF